MKRKVILYIAQSLDGFISDSKGSVNWILGNEENYDSDYGYETFIQEVERRSARAAPGLRLWK